MQSVRELAELIVHALEADSDTPPRLVRNEVELLARTFAENYGRPELPPHPGTVAVAPSCPKTAALLFERVWWPPNAGGDQPPSELRLYAATPSEIYALVIIDTIGYPDEQFVKRVLHATSETPIANLILEARSYERFMAEALRREAGVQALPVFASRQHLKQQYQPGDYGLVVAALQEIELVREDRLQWEQVLEFRKDERARRDYRRFLNWLDDDMAGKSGQQLADEINVRLDAYTDAIRKHGLLTGVGVAETLLDPKFGATAFGVYKGLELLGHPTIAAAAAGAYSATAIACSAVRGYFGIDPARQRYPEVAYVAEVHRAQSGTG